MGYSRLDYPYSGGPQDFPASFALGYIDPEDVQVYVIGEVDGFGAQTYRAFTWVSLATVRVTSALPNPCTVVILRTVDKEQLELDLESTGAVTRVTLTRAFKQLMMNIHELLDGRADAFQGVLFDVVEGLRDQALAYRDAALSHATTALTQADLALVRAGAAEVARLAAVVAQTAAEAAQTTAAGSATAASGSATTASGAIAATQAARDLTLAYRDATLAHRDAAAASATAAAGSAATAATQAGISTTKANEAASSAIAAALSAAALVKATTPEAQAGLNDIAYMTALKTAQTVAALGEKGRVLLSTAVAVNNVSLDFTAFNSAIYKWYEFEAENVRPSVTNQILYCRFSADGGLTYDAGASNYYHGAYLITPVGTGANFEETTGTAIPLSSNVSPMGIAANEMGFTGTIKMRNAGSAASFTHITYDAVAHNIYNQVHFIKGSGLRFTKQATNAIRFFMGSGNILTGEVRMYGIRA